MVLKCAELESQVEAWKAAAEELKAKLEASLKDSE